MNNPYVTKNNKTETVAGSDPWDMWFFTIVIGSMVPDYVTKKVPLITECYLHCCLAVLRRSCWL